jgi:hypothetical protein
MTDIYWPQKGVASPDVPSRADFLESKHSTRWPIVILDGIAWGLTIKSGTIPSLVNGRSSYLYVIPQVPFWPWREANLSPI